MYTKKKLTTYRNGHRCIRSIVLSAALLIGLLVPSWSAAAADNANADEVAHIYDSLASGSRVKPAERQYEAPEQPTVYLTFDDGPSKLTGQVLDILKREQIQATFFVLGEHAAEMEQDIRRMSEEGHVIGNHTYNHVYQKLYGDFDTFRDQVQKTEAVIEGITGSKPDLLRAPGGTYGNFDPFYYYYLEQMGYTVFDWNVDSRDAVKRGVPAEEIVSQVINSPLKHELIVLMHDGGGHEETVEALPEIISFYREQGYVFASLSRDVKPVQFTTAKSKWSRSYSLASFEGGLRLAAADGKARALAWAGTELDRKNKELAAVEADRRNEELLAMQAAEVQKEAAEALRKEREMPLTVRLGSLEWVMDYKSYDLELSRIAVPLRSMLEKMGARVEWDDESRTATVTMGGSRVEVDPIRRVVREFVLGRETKVTHMADVRLADGEIRVPLQAAARLFGGNAADGVVQEGMRTVEVRLKEEAMLAYSAVPPYAPELPSTMHAAQDRPRPAAVSLASLW